jgi:hypothetical protein
MRDRYSSNAIGAAAWVNGAVEKRRRRRHVKIRDL